MGLFGAALAAAIGPLISCAILFPSFLTGRGELRLSKKDWSLHHGEDILVSGIPSFVLEFTIGMMPVGAFQPVFYLLLSRFHGIFSQAIFWKGCCLKMLEEKMKELYGITLGKAA